MIKGIVFTLLIISLSAEARVFTDTKGREINAELVAHSGEKIVLTRAGKKFTVPISTFSSPDQVYIRNWIRDNPDAIDIDYKFRFYADCKEQKGVRQQDGAAIDDKVTFNDNTYEFIVYNIGSTEVLDVIVKYEIYIADFVVMKGNRYSGMASGAAKRETLEVVAGEEKVKFIPVKGRHSVMRKVSTESYIDRDSGKTDEVARDKMIGATVRVYKGDKMLAEYTHGMDDNRMSGISWKDKRPGKQER